MDFKLFGKILFAQGILFFVILAVLWLLNPAGIDLRIWFVLVLVFSLLSYRRQTQAAKQLEISQDHPAYQQKTFTTQLTSKITATELTHLINNSNDYLGEIILDDSLILKHAWKGVANMCTTRIKSTVVNGSQSYEIKTEPYWKYTIVDGYSGYQVHEVIKVLVSQ